MSEKTWCLHSGIQACWSSTGFPRPAGNTMQHLGLGYCVIICCLWWAGIVTATRDVMSDLKGFVTANLLIIVTRVTKGLSA